MFGLMFGLMGTNFSHCMPGTAHCTTCRLCPVLSRIPRHHDDQTSLWPHLRCIQLWSQHWKPSQTSACCFSQAQICASPAQQVYNRRLWLGPCKLLMKCKRADSCKTAQQDASNCIMITQKTAMPMICQHWKPSQMSACCFSHAQICALPAQQVDERI